MKSLMILALLGVTACSPRYYIAHGQHEILTTAEEVSRIEKDIVGASYRMNSTKGGSASGIVIGHDDTWTYILTNAHVADVGEGFVVTRGGKTYAAGVGLRADTKVDLAIVRAPRFDSPEVILADERHIPGLRFARALVYGFPMSDQSGHLTEGRISNVCDETGLIKISAPIIYGNSGGGIFAFIEGRYRLIGLARRIALFNGVPVPHIAWGVRVDSIRAFLAE